MNSDPHDIIPISFNMYCTLHEKHYNAEMKDRYLVQMHSQTKSRGIKLPEVHGVKKILDTSVLCEKQQLILQIKRNVENKPKLGQWRAGIRGRKLQLMENINTSTNKSHKILKIPMTQKVSKNRMDFPAQEQSISSSKTSDYMRNNTG